MIANTLPSPSQLHRRGRDHACAGLMAAALIAGGTPCAASDAPVLDRGFGAADGIARIGIDAVPFGRDQASSAVIADGRLVLAGPAQVEAAPSVLISVLAVAGFDAAGMPDPLLRRVGVGPLPLQPIYPSSARLARMQDGRFAFVASTTVDSQAYVGRLETNGDNDSSFNGSGHRVLATDFFVDDADHVHLYGVLPQTDGKTLVLGESTTSNAGQARACKALARFNPDGSIDSGFGGGRGSVCRAPPGAFAQALDGVVLGDGRILLAGLTLHPGGSGYDMSLTRLLPDGQLDTGFGPSSDGWAFIGFDQGGEFNDVAWAMAIDHMGRIVLAGSFETSEGADIGVARVLPSGQIDLGFGMFGRVQLGLGTVRNAFSVHVLADGRILVGNAAGNGAGLAAMLTSSGQLDPRFGDGGIFRQAAADAPIATIVATSRMLLEGEHLYMIGSTASCESCNRDFAATRYVLPLFRNGFD